MIYVLVTLLLVGFWVFCILDVLRTDASEVQHLPKGAWFAIVLVPLVGSVLWLLEGRARRSAAPGPRVAAPAPKGPEDDPAFLRDLERRLRDGDG
ncbi:PLD nuclease N-terminal domain-containing protein [Actinomadura livida]|uniref:Cardiolipin synthase N-terminal domain-containing protein n=1 Tax=Actinomadura livida TaxID=79909 RepID=A0A7W7IJX4_9ACTN|nr:MULTISPECIES: PLD nuclease N-terminal domain-containing protein [Actinomadura]MBB4778350.1 hypothetical protein [Actinomadura catellatispora]GGU25120.1 hypothetical protein GCM10010208_57630 [Actinomadura livida]